MKNNKKLQFGFVGLGLIGGSIARAVRKTYHDSAYIIAYDTDAETLSKAQTEGTIDSCYPSLTPVFGECDYLFLCAPVDRNDANLTVLRSFLRPGCLITDVGSVKSETHEVIKALGLEQQFIGGHPMAGSEKSGYANSSELLLENAYYILTPTELVPYEKLEAYRRLVLSFGAIPLILDHRTHDYITAAVSHLPHVIAACLVNLLQAADSKEELMKTIAAGGFKDITRIASSSPVMWQQICLANAEQITELLDRYIDSLSDIRRSLKAHDAKALYSLFESARLYRDSFQDVSSGPIRKIHGFYVDIPDEPGVISTISAILAGGEINLKNIGIVHNREFEEGVLRLEFYDASSSDTAVTILDESGYTIHPRKS